MADNATSTQLQELYVAYFGRAADPAGLDYWTKKGITTSKFAADMYAQAEFKDVYGSLSTESQVNQIYENLFDRAADATGLLYWTQEIDLGNLQLAEIATHLIWAAKNNAGSEDDKTALSNKTDAAIAYTAKVKEDASAILAYQAESTSPWKSGVNIAEAVSYMSGINKDTASTAAGIAASVTTITGNGVPSESANYSLTSNVDDIAGTAGTNKISAGLTSSGANTLNSLDEIDGKGGTDTLNASIATTVIPLSIKNVENINLTFEAAKTVSAVNITGVTKYTNSGSIALGTISNIGDATADLKVADNDQGATFTYKAAALTGTADSIDLELANATGGNTVITTITGAVETVNLTSSTSANSVRLDSDATTLNISGSADLTLGVASTILNQTTTINAGSATGAITLASDNTLAGTAGAVTITGGSGNDALTSEGAASSIDTLSGGSGDDRLIFGADLADADIVNGGAGTDTLVGDDGELAGLTTANNVSNIEVIEASTVLATSLTTANIDSTISSVTLTAGANAGTVVFGAGSNTLKMGTASAGALTVTDTGLATTDTLTINSSTVDSFNNNSVAVNGFETVNFSTGTGTTTTEQDVSTFNVTGDPDSDGLRTAATLNISGKGNFHASGVITVGTDGSGTGTIDASGLTGNLVMDAATAGATTITGGSGNDTILGDSHASTLTGGAGDDAITGGAASDTINGGAGNDTFTLTAAALTTVKDTISGGAGNDTFYGTDTNLASFHVLDGGDGTDTLKLDDLSAVADSQLENNTSIEVITSDATGLSATLDTYAQAMGITTVTLAGTANGGVADTVTIQNDVTNAITVNLDAAVAADTNTIDASTYTGVLTLVAGVDTAINADTGVTSTLTGGTGTADELKLVGDTYTAAQLASVTAIEKFTITNDAAANITIDNGTVADGKTLLVDGRAIVSAANGLTFSAGTEADGIITVHGATGGDAITASLSDLGDTINTYAGADTVSVVAAQLTTLDTIDGGAGTDILSIITTAATLADADFTNVSNMETLTFTSIASSDTDLGAEYTAAGFSTINLAASVTNDLNLDSVTTAQKVNLLAGTDTIDASSMTAALTVNVDSNDLTSGDTITAGTGTSDVLEIDYDSSATAATALNNVTGFETIKFVDGDAANSVTIVDAVVAATKSLTIDATINATTVSTITMSAETNGAVTILGGHGGNTITASASSMGDTITGGSGTDGVTIAVAQLTSADTINGVSGTDTITLSDGGTLSDADFTGVTNFDVLTFSNTATTLVLGSEFEESSIATINDGTGADSITLGAGVTSAATIALSSGNDTVTAEASGAAITFTIAEDNLTSGDTLTGGTGSDILTITFDDETSIDTVSASDMSGVTKIETIKTGGNHVGSLTLSDNNTVSGVLTINAEANTGDAFTLDASAENDGTITYSGGGGVDTVTGTATTATGDTISAGAGADVIDGGLGGDTITGGAGADTFTYTAVGQSTGSARDSITDFTSGTDKFNVTINNSTDTGAATYDCTVQTARAGTSEVQANLSGSIGQVIYDTTNSRMIINGNADNLVTTLDWQIDVNAAATAASTIADGDIIWTITGGSGADTITTGSEADTITTGAGGGTVTAGGGNDTLTFGGGTDTFALAYGGEGIDTIGSFTAGTDIIDFTGTRDVNDAANTDLDVDGFLLFANTDDHAIIDGLTVFAGSSTTAIDAGSYLTAAEIATFLGDLDGSGNGTDNHTVTVGSAADVAYVLVEGAAGNTTLAQVTGGTDTTIDAANVTLIAHFTAAESEDFTSASFSDFA